MSRRELKGIGAPIRLPMRVAFQVAWTSIRVRMVRSLVTVSSVVLAVAFLLSVLGEADATAAVWRRHAEATRPDRQATALRAALERPRSAEEGLRIIGGDAAGIAAWHAGLPAADGAAPAWPAVDGADAVLASRLIRWVGDLKPSQAYLLCRNLSPAEFAASLDADGALSRCREVIAGFKGVRAPLSEDELDRLDRAAPALRAAIAAFADAESRRLGQVAAAGGPAAVMDRLAAGADDRALAALGLPVGQILGRLESGERADLIAQAKADRLIDQANAALAAYVRADQSQLRADDVADWAGLHAALVAASADGPVKRLTAISPRVRAALSGDPDAERLRSALNSSLSNISWWDAKTFAAAGVALDGEAAKLSQLNLSRMAEVRVTRLNRLLLEAVVPGRIRHRPPAPTLDLARIAGGSLSADPGAAEAVAAVQAAAAAAGSDMPALDAALRRRAQGEEMAAIFLAKGYDPEASGQRTFWLVVLSLIVCVVGIVNTMTMAVTERFREIATMKCLGALDTFILKAFLIESAAMGLVGAALGAALGGALVLAQAAAQYGGAFFAAFPASALLASAGTAIGCGLGLAILGALFPALQAARMAPIEAMRIDL